MGRDINFWAELRQGNKWLVVGGEARANQPPNWIVFRFGEERNKAFYDILMTFPERGERHIYSWNSWVSLLELEQRLIDQMPIVMVTDLEFLDWMCTGQLPLRSGHTGPLPAGYLRPDRLRSLILAGRSGDHCTGILDLSQFQFRHIWQSLGALYALGSAAEVRISFSIDR